MKTCTCGSNLPRHELHDGRGIFMTFVCDECRARKLKSFRPDIFTEYPTDEQIESDY